MSSGDVGFSAWSGTTRKTSVAGNKAKTQALFGTPSYVKNVHFKSLMWEPCTDIGLKVRGY